MNETVEKPAGAGRGVKVALVASLALNLLLGGLIAGRRPASSPRHGAWRPRRCPASPNPLDRRIARRCATFSAGFPACATCAEQAEDARLH